MFVPTALDKPDRLFQKRASFRPYNRKSQQNFLSVVVNVMHFVVIDCK